MPKRKRKKAGTPPGSLIFMGEQKLPHSNVMHIQYDEATYTEQQLHTLQQTHQSSPLISWYDIKGLHETNIISSFGNLFSIHPLAQEDILNPHCRPKLDEYEKGFFIILKSLQLDKVNFQLLTEQVSIFCTHKAVISFQEDAEDLFAPIRERIANESSRIRKRGADFLAYTLVDAVIDNYFLVLDEIEDYIEQLEAELNHYQRTEHKMRIHQLKRIETQMRKFLLPTREAISQLTKENNEYIATLNVPYWRDIYDHINQAIDITDDQKNMLVELQNLLFAQISYKLNNVIQVLTIISTIFIPLTFIAGIYGMNFDNMPELRWHYGYYACLLLMLIVALGMLGYFKYKKWL